MKKRLLFSRWALALSVVFASAAGAEVPIPVWRKLDSWVVPKVEMENLNLGEAVAWVRAKSREIDPRGSDGDDAGLRIGFERVGADEPDLRVTVKAEDVLLGDLLDRIGEMTSRKVEIFEDGVVLRGLKGKSAAVPGMLVRTYGVSLAFENPELATGGDGISDPFVEAGESGPSDAQSRAKFGSAEARAALEGQGIHLPEGSTVTYSPRPGGGYLTVRTTPSLIELTDAFFAVLDGPGSEPMECVIQVEVYGLESGKALALVRQSAGTPGAKRLLGKLNSLVEAGEAELLAAPVIVTRSGQRAKLENVLNREIVTGYTVVEGRDRAETAYVSSGTVFEVDPVIGADGITIDLNIALEVETGEPKITRKEILAPVSGKPVSIEHADISAGKIQTALSTRNGQPQLLGVFPPRGDSKQARLIFVTATIRPVRDEFPVPE